MTRDILNLFVSEPAEVYHAAAKDNLSSHRLADFRRCPLLYHWKQTGLAKDEDRPAYQIGRAVRTLQRYARVVRDEFRDEIDYLDEQYRVVKGEVDTARQTLRDEQARFQAEIREATPTSLDLLPASASSQGGVHAVQEGFGGEPTPSPAVEAAGRILAQIQGLYQAAHQDKSVTQFSFFLSHE